MRTEIDSVLERHGDPGQTPHETFGRLSIDVWESEFPLIELCLRECIRLHLAGSAFRRNISGQSVPIGSTGEAIPKDAYLVSIDFLKPSRCTNPEPDMLDSFISLMKFISTQISTLIQTSGTRGDISQVGLKAPIFHSVILVGEPAGIHAVSWDLTYYK